MQRCDKQLVIFVLSKPGYRGSTHHADVQGRFKAFKGGLRNAKDHSFSGHALLVTVGGIKHEAILLAINCDFVILKPGKAKDKGVSLQLSDVTEDIVRNMITGEQIQQDIMSNSTGGRFTAVKNMQGMRCDQGYQGQV